MQYKGGRSDLNRRPSRWQRDAPPLSYARKSKVELKESNLHWRVTNPPLCQLSYVGKGGEPES